MNIYSIGYGTCEESHYWQYWHEQAFSQEELEKIVNECILAAHLELHKSSEMAQTFQNIMASMQFHQELIKHGFIRVEFKKIYSVFGWSHIKDLEDWQSYAEEDTRRAQRFMLENIPKG